MATADPAYFLKDPDSQRVAMRMGYMASWIDESVL
jgi:hypothetical protein